MSDETTKRLIQEAQEFLDEGITPESDDTKVIYNPTAQQLVDEGFGYYPRTAVISSNAAEILLETGVLKVVVDEHTVWIRVAPL